MKENINTLKKYHKIKYLSLLFTFFIGAATAEPTKIVQVTDQIKGSPPVLASIGSKFAPENIFSELPSNPLEDNSGPPVIDNYTIIKQVIDAREVFIPTVNSILEIPVESVNELVYQYIDRDGDLDSYRSQIQWYIVDLKDSTGKKWPEPFLDVNTTKEDPSILINEEDLDLIPIPSLDGNPNKVKIPPAAINKRIGFSIIPESKTGFPTSGQRIFLADLNYIQGQMYEGTNNPEKVKSLGIMNNNFNNGGGEVLIRPGLKSNRLSYIFDNPNETVVSYDFVYRKSDLIKDEDLVGADLSDEKFDNKTLFILKRTDTGQVIFSGEAQADPFYPNRYNLEFVLKGEDRYHPYRLSILPENKGGIQGYAFGYSIANPDKSSYLVDVVAKLLESLTNENE